VEVMLFVSVFPCRCFGVLTFWRFGANDDVLIW
jgi:hypothetical protein